jgi:hypothetical protein
LLDCLIAWLLDCLLACLIDCLIDWLYSNPSVRSSPASSKTAFSCSGDLNTPPSISATNGTLRLSTHHTRWNQSMRYLIPDSWFLCDSFVIPLWFLCDSFVIPLWFLCDSFVIPLWFLCDSFVIPSWFQQATYPEKTRRSRHKCNTNVTQCGLRLYSSVVTQYS